MELAEIEFERDELRAKLAQAKADLKHAQKMNKELRQRASAEEKQQRDAANQRIAELEAKVEQHKRAFAEVVKANGEKHRRLEAAEGKLAVAMDALKAHEEYCCSSEEQGREYFYNRFAQLKYKALAQITNEESSRSVEQPQGKRNPESWLDTRLCELEILVQAAEEKLQAAERKLAELGQQLEFDRSLVADCLAKARKAVRSRDWLTEGRGCYEWNDDRWHEEFQYAANEFLAAIEPMGRVARDWSGCPQSAEEVAQSRIDLKQRAEEAERKLATLTDQNEELKACIRSAALNYHGRGNCWCHPSNQDGTHEPHCMWIQGKLADIEAQALAQIGPEQIIRPHTNDCDCASCVRKQIEEDKKGDKDGNSSD
jgi:hypothetical protein